MSKARRHLVSGATIALFFGAAAPALAVDGTKTVSCDVAYVTSLVTLTAAGDVSVKQVDTSPDNNRYYDGISSNGNAIGRKATVDGRAVSWTSVRSGTYTFKTQIVSNTNCNGILPGQGNSTLTYTVNP